MVTIDIWMLLAIALICGIIGIMMGASIARGGSSGDAHLLR